MDTLALPPSIKLLIDEYREEKQVTFSYIYGYRPGHTNCRNCRRKGPWILIPRGPTWHLGEYFGYLKKQAQIEPGLLLFKDKYSHYRYTGRYLELNGHNPPA